MENLKFFIPMLFLSLFIIMINHLDFTDAAPTPGHDHSDMAPYILTAGLIAKLLQHG